MRILRWCVIGVAALALIGGGYWYYEHGLRYPSTDDAYIKANVVNIAAEVSGRAIKVPVDDQDLVKKGELLFQIDPRPFQLKVAHADAQLSLAKQQVGADQAAVEAAEAQVNNVQAKLNNDQLRYKRLRSLRAHNSVSQADLDDAQAVLKSSRASLALAKARLNEAKMKLGSTGENNATVHQARANLKMARLNLGYTTVRAPCDGRISNLSMRPGDVIQPQRPLFALVCIHEYWVYANYKETDLGRIRPGQKATIKVDMYPNHSFHGVVESIAPASGAAFSLLPPENATGNWVKVTQRVPVRIRITDDDRAHPLRVQTSTTVTIDTGPGKNPAGDTYLANRGEFERTATTKGQ